MGLDIRHTVGTLGAGLIATDGSYIRDVPFNLPEGMTTMSGQRPTTGIRVNYLGGNEPNTNADPVAALQAEFEALQAEFEALQAEFADLAAANTALTTQVNTRTYERDQALSRINTMKAFVASA